MTEIDKKTLDKFAKRIAHYLVRSLEVKVDFETPFTREQSYQKSSEFECSVEGIIKCLKEVYGVSFFYEDFIGEPFVTKFFEVIHFQDEFNFSVKGQVYAYKASEFEIMDHVVKDSQDNYVRLQRRLLNAKECELFFKEWEENKEKRKQKLIENSWVEMNDDDEE